MLSVPFPPATVLLNENLKQNRMSLFPCCKTVSIDGFQSISKHALQLHQHRPVVNNGSVQGIYDAFLLRTMIPGEGVFHTYARKQSLVPLFPEIPGTMLLHYQASKVPRCPNLWRAGVSYLPCLRTRDATGIVLLTGTDTCLEDFDIKCFSPG